MSEWHINPLAFEPRSVDVDGISLFRQDFVTQEVLAKLSGHAHGVRVARVTVNDCRKLHLSVKPSPDPNVPPGHVVIPEMPFIKKTPQTKVQKQEVKDLAQKLTQVASKMEVYSPPGLPDPFTKV